jgi:hypothetical protein
MLETSGLFGERVDGAEVAQLTEQNPLVYDPIYMDINNASTRWNWQGPKMDSSGLDQYP